ncbi:GNAT family N-acetyltransferase [Natronorubrum halophilum]|uniref:GNAT family N-acetyltransferase n=1 Tax=Natronorubrum halophilum TaxID=1702106 RepID=UPI0010C1B758|nr:GNAT family N-acetyltransferase [Natronorubrum halophilum]
MALENQTSGSDDYRVRTYEPGDRDGILSLFETEWGYRPSADWFDWKYVDDPYLSHVPITLAERDGEIVAVQGYVPCRVRRGERTVSALKPVDAVVHPDHRRKGLYSRITERGIRHYTDRESAFFFNFPNAASLGAQQKLGWSEVTVVPMYYRLQRPSELLPTGQAAAPAGRVADSIARTGLGLWEQIAATSAGYDVERYASPPGNALESIYESDVPRTFHVHREAQYYRWVLDAPSAGHTVYVANRDGRPVAALVTRSNGDGDVMVFDAVPLGANHDAFADLLAAVIADNEGASTLSVTDQTLSSTLLSRFGFVSYETPILSRLCTPTHMAVRPLSSEEGSGPFSRRELADAENWSLSFLEVKD